MHRPIFSTLLCVVFVVVVSFFFYHTRTVCCDFLSEVPNFPSALFRDHSTIPLGLILPKGPSIQAHNTEDKKIV